MCSDLAVLLSICCLGQLEIGRPVSGKWTEGDSRRLTR